MVEVQIRVALTVSKPTTVKALVTGCVPTTRTVSGARGCVAGAITTDDLDTKRSTVDAFQAASQPVAAKHKSACVGCLVASAENGRCYAVPLTVNSVLAKAGLVRGRSPLTGVSHLRTFTFFVA